MLTSIVAGPLRIFTLSTERINGGALILCPQQHLWFVFLITHLIKVKQGHLRRQVLCSLSSVEQTG